MEGKKLKELLNDIRPHDRLLIHGFGCKYDKVKFKKCDSKREIWGKSKYLFEFDKFKKDESSKHESIILRRHSQGTSKNIATITIDSIDDCVLSEPTDINDYNEQRLYLIILKPQYPLVFCD